MNNRTLVWSTDAFLSFLQVIYTMRIEADKIPSDLIAMTLEKWKNNTGNHSLKVTDYILKVIGMEDYLYGEYPLRTFKVRSCINTHN